MNVTPEEFIEQMRDMSSYEKHHIRQERAERTRKRREILLKIERLEMFRCEKCQEREPGNLPSRFFKCDCVAAVEIRRLGKELDQLTSPVEVEEVFKEEKPTTTPDKTKTLIYWSDEMTDIVKREIAEGVSAHRIWKKHFSSLMSLPTFQRRTLDIREKAMGNKIHQLAQFTKEDVEDIRRMILDNVPRKVIREKYGHVKKSTMDWRIAQIRKQLKEEGLL